MPVKEVEILFPLLAKNIRKSLISNVHIFVNGLALLTIFLEEPTMILKTIEMSI